MPATPQHPATPASHLLEAVLASPVGEVHSVDFHNGTATFTLPEGARIGPGRYCLVPYLLVLEGADRDRSLTRQPLPQQGGAA